MQDLISRLSSESIGMKSTEMPAGDENKLS